MNLENCVVLVTGGGSGLGAACARRFHLAGAKVVVADVDADAGASIATELGARSVFVEVDVTSADAVTAAVVRVVDDFGALRGVVNCAGVLGAARIVGRDGPQDLAAFARVIEVNLIGTFNVMRVAAAAMATNEPDEEGERGVIINTSSVAAFEGQIGQAAYSASKGGVASMTLPAARELARSGIRVISIAPGVFLTPMMNAAPPQVLESLEAQAVFPKRLGEADEFAALAQHVFENRMLNGEVIRLDGAMRMGPK